MAGDAALPEPAPFEAPFTSEMRVMSKDERNYYADHDEELDPRGPYRRMPSPPASGMAIASLVCGVCLCVPFITSLLAVVFGFIGIRKTQDPYVGGKGMSIAGLVLGVIGLSVWIGLFGLFVSFSQFLLREQTRAQATATAFVQDLSDSKIDAALARAIPGFDRAQLSTASDAMKGNGPFNELMVELQPVPTPGKIEFNRWVVEGDAVFSRGRKPIHMRLVNDHGTYRIESFDLR